MSFQETPDRIHGRLEPEVAKEERRRRGLFLSRKDLLRKLGLTPPSGLHAGLERRSGLRGATFEAVA